MKKRNPEIRFDKFIESVRPDPKSNPLLKVLEGFIGKSSEEEHIRVYFDESLNKFVEIPLNAILHSAPNSSENNTLGGSKLWVKADTVFVYGDPSQNQRPKGSFLQGSLYANYTQNYPQGNVGNLHPSYLPGCTNGIDCLPSNNCPSEYMTACVSNLIKCTPFSQGGKSVCIMCPPFSIGGKSVCFCIVTEPPNCPNGRTCVNTCNEPGCLPATSPQTCTPPSPTIPGGPYCLTTGQGDPIRSPGYGFGNFNPYQY